MAATVADKQIDFPIIDSHIHLYAEAHLQDLAWAPSLPVLLGTPRGGPAQRKLCLLNVTPIPPDYQPMQNLHKDSHD